MASNDDDDDELCILDNTVGTKANVDFNSVTQLDSKLDEMCLLDEDLPVLENNSQQPVDFALVKEESVAVKSAQEDFDGFVWAEEPEEPAGAVADDECILEGSVTKPKKNKKTKKPQVNKVGNIIDENCILEEQGILCKKYSSMTTPDSEVENAVGPLADDSSEFTEFQSAEEWTPICLPSGGPISNEPVVAEQCNGGLQTDTTKTIDSDDTCILKTKVKKRDIKLCKDGDNKCILKT